MVEVFKTNVHDPEQSETLVRRLIAQFPGHRINFDLDDCDRILRVEGKIVSPEKVVELVSNSGYQCLVLE